MYLYSHIRNTQILFLIELKRGDFLFSTSNYQRIRLRKTMTCGRIWPFDLVFAKEYSAVTNVRKIQVK